MSGTQSPRWSTLCWGNCGKSVCWCEEDKNNNFVLERYSIAFIKSFKVASVCHAAAALWSLFSFFFPPFPLEIYCLLIATYCMLGKIICQDKISMSLLHSWQRMRLKPSNIRKYVNATTLDWHLNDTKYLFVTESLLWIWACCAEQKNSFLNILVVFLLKEALEMNSQPYCFFKRDLLSAQISLLPDLAFKNESICLFYWVLI